MPTEIQYDHKQNLHTTAGADAAFPVILGNRKIASFLDVGCGPGTWLAAAERYGIRDTHGVDGIKRPAEEFHAPGAVFTQADLNEPFSLGRKFDLALCTEVAEHLTREAADSLVTSLCAHADLIAFSAAIPGQPGQHHITCEWPAFWQEKFNRCGFVCEDVIRWKLWDNDAVEGWYRQNLFLARRDPAMAGKEKRIIGVIHPAMYEMMMNPVRYEALQHVEYLYYGGRIRPIQYAILLFRALSGKLGRLFRMSSGGPA